MPEPEPDPNPPEKALLPLVRFQRIGSDANHHRYQPRDEARHFQLAEIQQRRALKSRKPLELGQSSTTGAARRSAKEQELRWLELSKQ